MGAIAALTGSGLAVRVQAKTDVRLAQIDSEEFLELAVENRVVLRRVLERVRPVVGRITAIEQNRERLDSLGTMAAGLAHELNNPASAAKRASADLADALDVLSSTIGAVRGIGRRARAGRAAGRDPARRGRGAAARAASMSQLELADAEDELIAALEDAGIAEAYRIVEPLAQAGVDESQLAHVKELAGPATEAAVRWIAASLLARELAAELGESTERMSKLVGAVKTYAYMDRGGLVEVDVREGLETTLTILGHKLKHTTIGVQREIDEDLPRFQAYGAELNQVWTNLLDNAIDALGDSGTITISAHRDGDCVEVDIADDGPGVAPEAAERDLRSLLHDQGGRQGHRPRPRHRAADRRRPPPRQPHAEQRARADRVPRAAARGAVGRVNAASAGVAVRAVDARTGRELRMAVLRPDQPPGEAMYPLEEARCTAHYAACDPAGEVLAVGSVMPEGHPRHPREGDWRVRGMATRAALRGAGLGGMVLAELERHAREHGGRRVWCNARTGARRFYEGAGFEVEGGEFEIPGIGPHLLMAKPLR